MTRYLLAYWSGSSWEDEGNSPLQICHRFAFDVEWPGFVDRVVRGPGEREECRHGEAEV